MVVKRNMSLPHSRTVRRDDRSCDAPRARPCHPERRSHPPFAIFCGLFLLLAFATPAAEIASSQVLARYEEMLSRRPRQGTSLERLYRMHVEAMDVQAWLDGLVEQAAGEDASAALLAGLALVEHGAMQEALPLLDRAAALAPEEAYPRYIRGRVSYQQRDYAEAIAWLRGAAEMEGAREDQVQILTLLGTCQVRAGNASAGIATWDRILALAGDDHQLVEELAEVLYEEDQLDAAARYYRTLLDDPAISMYQRVLYTSKLAGIRARQEDVDGAMELYDAVLDQVGPEHWLFGEALGHIEALFRARGAFDELAAYYESRLAAHPAGTDLLLRLAGVHRLRNDPAAERATLERALERAPTRSDIRWALARALIDDEQWQGAVEALEVLAREEPDRLDIRLALGRTLLRAGNRDQGVRWLRDMSDDPAQILQAAELLREEGCLGETEELLARAADLAPELAEYAERLADFYFQAQRPDEGVAALRRLVASPEATGGAWARLAEGLAQRGYLDEGLVAAREATRRSPASFDTGMVLVTLLMRSGLLVEALAEVERLQPLAVNEYFADDLADRRIHLLRRTGGLEEAYARQVAGLDPGGTVADRLMAARMALALRYREEALRWIESVVAMETSPLPALEAAEKMLKELGEIDQAQAVLERMLGVAPERAPDILRRQFDLYHHVGDLTGAARAANRLIERLPASADGYRLAAQAAAGMGRVEEAFDLMRRAAQAAPRDATIRVRFAQMLEANDLLSEAIEMYWQALELYEDDADKLALIQPMAGLYLDQDRFDQFLDRLARWRRLEDDRTTPSLALVMAHEEVGDYEKAETELASLAGQRPRDTAVLSRLVRMTEEAGDLETAIVYLRRLVQLEPSAVHHEHLGDLLLEVGEREAALAAWGAARDTQTGRSPEQQVAQQVAWIDRLWEIGFEEEARAALKELYATHGGDWRAVLWVGVALLEDDDPTAAIPVLRQVVDWPREERPPAPAAPWVDPREFPEDYETIQYLSMARWLVSQPTQRGLTTGFGGQGPIDLKQARALAIAHLASLEGTGPALDTWWTELTTGSLDQRRLALQMAVVLQDPERTRAMAAELVRDFPQDTFARYVLMVPSQAELQTGMKPSFFEQVRTQLAWLRKHQPQHAWFHDWHYMNLLVENDDPEPIRAFAEEMDARAQSDPLLLALVTSLLERSRLYDVYERNVDGAVRFYRENGEHAQADQVLQALGRMAVQATQEDDPETGLRLLRHFLDAIGPVAPTPAGQALDIGDLHAPFPLPNAWWDRARIGVLEQMQRALAGIGAEERLVELMTRRTDSSAGSEQLRSLLGLAYVHWWNGDPDLVDAALMRALAVQPADPELPLQVAHFYARTQRPRRALELVAAVQTRYGPRHRLVQGWLLELAAEARDLPAAREAARELMRMRLEPEALADLADRMAAIGMLDEADRIQRRSERYIELTQRRSGTRGFAGTIQASAERMSRYLQQGQPDEAQTAALRILKVLPGAPAHEQATFRKQALETLRSMGRLESSITAVETEFAAYPDRNGLMELLFSLYRAAGRGEDADALIERYLGTDLASADTRLHFARMFVNENELESAAVQVEWLLEHAPEVFFGRRPEYWMIGKAFRMDEGGDRLTAALAKIPADLLVRRRPRRHTGQEQVVGNVMNFCRDVLADEKLPDQAALLLCEKIEPSLSVRHLRQRYAANLLEMKAEALQSTGKTDAAFRVLADCVLALPIREGFGSGSTFVPSAQPLSGVKWGQERMDAVVFRFLDAAEEAGRLEALADALGVALTAGQPEVAFPLALVRLRLSDREGFDAILDRAMNQPAEPAGRSTLGWTLLNQRALIGQALLDAGRPEAAIGIFQQALNGTGNDPVRGMNDTLVKYLVDACVAAGRVDQARAILHEVLERAAASGLQPPNHAARVNQIKVKAMHQFHELGFAEDAMDLGLELLSLTSEPHHGYYRRQAEIVMNKVREDGLAGLQSSGRLEGALREAEAEIAGAPGEMRGWQKLLWLTQAGSPGPEVAQVRQRIAEAFPGDMAWRYRLARSAIDGGDVEEAWAHLLSVLRQAPEEIFRHRNAYRDLFTLCRETGRFDDFEHAVKSMAFDRLVVNPNLARFERATVLQQAVQVAVQAVRPPAERPAIALHMAKGLRPLMGRRPELKSFLEQLDAAMLTAIRMSSGEPRAKVDELAAMMLSTETRERVGINPAGRAHPVPWTLGMDWKDRTDHGLLPALLQLADSAKRSEALESACAQATDPMERDVLRWLLCLGRGAPVPVHELAAVEEAVLGLPTGADERAYLLVVFADGLRRVGQRSQAEILLRRALDICAARGRTAPWLLIRSELVSLMRADGREQDAVDLLMSDVAPRTHALPIQQAREFAVTIEQDAAVALLEMDRLAEAWEKAHRALVQAAPYPDQSKIEPVRKLLVRIESRYIPEQAEQGGLERLIDSLRDHPLGAEHSMEMLGHIYRMYRAAGDETATERVLDQIRTLRPGDAHTRLAAAELLRGQGRMSDAAEQYRSVQELAPGLLLGSPSQATACLSVFHALGQVREFARRFAEAGLLALVRGMRAGDGQADTVAESLVALAGESMAEPVRDPEAALLFLQPLEEPSRGLISIRQWRRRVYEAKAEALRALDRTEALTDVLAQLVIPAEVLSRLGVEDRIGAPVPLDHLLLTRGDEIGGTLVEFLGYLEAYESPGELAGACAESSDVVSGVLGVCAGLRAGEVAVWERVDAVRRRIRSAAEYERTAANYDLLFAGEAERAGLFEEAAELLAESARRAAANGMHAEESRLVLARADLLGRTGQAAEAVRSLRTHELSTALGVASAEGVRSHRTAFYREAARRLLAYDRILAALDRVHQALAEEPDRRDNLSLRTTILRQRIPELGGGGRLAELVRDVDERLAGETPTAADWETRFWCAHAAGDEAGMIAARDQVLARSATPGRVAIEFGRLGLKAGNADDAVALFLRAWQDQPAAWFAAAETSRDIARAFAVAGRLDELQACLAQRPLREVVRDVAKAQVLPMASRLRRADLNEFEAGLAVANWVRDSVPDNGGEAELYGKAEREAESALRGITDPDVAFREYSRRVCSPSLARELGLPREENVMFWGQEWKWEGDGVDCFPGRWVALVERLNRVPDLLNLVDRLDRPGPGDHVLAYILRVRSGEMARPDGLDAQVAVAARALDRRHTPELDLWALAWIALEWNRAGWPVPAAELLSQVRADGLARGNGEGLPFSGPLSLTLARLLAENGQQEQALAVLSQILEIKGGNHLAFYQDQARDLIQAWEKD